MLPSKIMFWLGMIIASVSLNGFADRAEICLNGEWDFQPVAGRGDLNELPKNNWSETKIRVPSSWTNSQKEWGYPASFENTERAYYRRTFDLPAGLAGKRVLIKFGSIFYKSRIWVNGKPVADTRLAYVPYEIDITSAVKPGAGNEIILGVEGVYTAVEKGHALLPCGTNGAYLGLMDDVTLKIVPDVYISDVFVMPSVRKGKLAVQVEVTNPSANPFKGKAVCHVLTLTGSPVKTFSEISVNVPAGKTITVTGEINWSDARLWWPNDPHLYKLRTRLYGTNDADETCTRFGFREFWCDGPDFKLNGKRIRLMQGATSNACYIHGSLLQPENIRAKWALMKQLHVTIDRLHCMPHPQVVLDTADEFGMPIIAEGCFVPVNVEGVDGETGNMQDAEKFGLRYNVAKNPELWKEYYCRWIRANRNHPSIFMWSLFNEMAWNNYLNPIIYAPARSLDPTRPMYCDGAADDRAWGSDDKMMTEGFVGTEHQNYGNSFPDMNGLADLLTSHYGFPTRTNFQSTDNPSYRFPEACYYLEGLDIHKSRNTGKIKPVGKGEYSFIWCAPPDWISFYGGDRAYQGVWAQTGTEGYWQVHGQIGRDEGHGLRYAGVNTLCWWAGTFASLAINNLLDVNYEFKWDRLDTPGFKPRWARTYLLQVEPWSNPGNPRHIKTQTWPYLADIQDPKLVLLVDPARTFTSRQKLSRRFALFNETFEDALDAKAVWSLNQGDKKLLGGQIPVKVEHGRTYKGTVEFTLTQVQTPTPVTFTLQWIVAGKEWNKRSQEWEILPAFTPHVNKGKPLYCYDPNHAMDTVLKGLGQSKKPVSDSLPDGNNFSLLIAPNALDDQAVGLVRKAMKQGANVAVLDQKKWAEGFLKQFGTKIDPGTRSMAFVRNPTHPILEGVNRDIHLGHWGTEGQIADMVLEKPARGSFRDVVYADRDNSMLLELRGSGGGACILTTLQLVAWSEASPSAKRILANLVDYLCTAKPWETKPAFLLAGENSPLRETLERMNVRFSTAADRETPIFVDARTPIEEKNLALLRQHLDAGGNVYIHALTPESLKAFGDLLSGIELEPTGLTKCQNFEITAFDPLTGNLSGKDCFYPTVDRPMAPLVLKRSSLPKGTVIMAAEPEWTGDAGARNISAHLVIQFGKWKLAERKTPGAVLAVLPGRKGKVVVCQLAWDEFVGYRGATGMGLAILNGLNVDLTKTPKQTTWDKKRFSMLDLRPACNTTFADHTPAEDGKGGWSDEGAMNDMRDLKAGIHVDRGVPFRILDEQPARPNTCLILYSKNVRRGKPAAEISPGLKCSSLHFLHASIWRGDTLTNYIVEYADKSSVKIPIRNGDEIDNWWVGCDSQARNAKIGWMGSNPSRNPIGLWHFTWPNPHPDRVIEKITFHSDPTSTSSVALVAVTAQVSTAEK